VDFARPAGSAWSNKLRLLVSALTAIGVVGLPVVCFGPLFEYLGRQGGIRGGCGGGGAILVAMLFGAIVVVLVVVAVLGAVSLVGIILLSLKSFAGPLLLFTVNLLTMTAYGLIDFTARPESWGTAQWALVNLAFGAAPAIAAALVLWPLLTGGWARERVAQVVVLGLVALLPVLTYGYGVAFDVAFAWTAAPPPQVVASAGCGPAPSAGLPAGTVMTTTR
jgi:hypothetical protein